MEPKDLLGLPLDHALDLLANAEVSVTVAVTGEQGTEPLVPRVVRVQGDNKQLVLTVAYPPILTV